ncbi:MBL fold metallo-hydrolase [Albimonas pacifica]|uniref:Glyoxylase, beta-lactamase superfamily II n=1 Tax=Albimonas pacifica TaxID=1114924 RepID=A0A1I3H5Y1_9RHOB|nr:MBL fold metallo-hydrolase [Albimonas pacifica]SFI31126.1 Glyoxylase, beta-lactamase superfamily II [Albimonas pacifica]
MRLTRRRLLTAAAAAAMALPRRAWTATTLEGGGMRLDTLSDGRLELPPSFLFGTLPEAEAAEVMARHGLSPDAPLIAPCNVTLLRSEDRTALFDVGAGPDFQPTAGELPAALDALGVAPEKITDVIFTHGHPDHLWGLLDEFDEPLFPEAALWMGGTEFDYWTDPATAGSIGEARLAFYAGASRRLEAVADRMRRIADGDVPLPGVTARLTPGHTPGHMAFDLGQALLVGDCIGNGHVAFSDPAMALGSDQAPQEAAETRAKLMAELAASGQALIGFHLPEGGIGTVRTEGQGYRFAPA